MAGRLGADAIRPWGWQLRVRGGVIEDAEGRQFRSVRQAFWEGHLRFPWTYLAPDQMELLLRVLSSLDHHWVGPAENKHDLFCGDMAHWRFYQCWLWSIGLLEREPNLGPLSARLSNEGYSVLLMLQATREPAWIPLPFGSVLDAVRASERTAADEEREQALRAFERGITHLPHLFAREEMHRHHLVTLTGLDTNSRMPLRKVVWSLSFPEGRPRDDFFAWLAERVHRWEDWGQLAYSKGADALTQHLLSLFAAGVTDS